MYTCVRDERVLSALYMLYSNCKSGVCINFTAQKAQTKHRTTQRCLLTRRTLCAHKRKSARECEWLCARARGRPIYTKWTLGSITYSSFESRRRLFAVKATQTDRRFRIIAKPRSLCVCVYLCKCVSGEKQVCFVQTWKLNI